MGNNSSIQWTDATWNIARGCTKVDEDCKFCYMYRESLNGTRYEPKNIVKTKTVFNLPLKLKQPSKIFTSSLTDFFHEECDSFRDEAWDIIKKCPQHDQFIGLFDVNGQRIFENDIVSIANMKKLKGATGVVKFIHGSWKAEFSHHNFLMSLNQRKSYHFEVVGNVHQQNLEKGYRFITESFEER